MNRYHHTRLCMPLMLVALIAATSLRPVEADDQPERKLLEGSWVVITLVEDGEVIPSERIPEVLPSGGRVDIVDNSMLFVDAKTGIRHSRTISVDATRYPATIDLTSADHPEVSHGIYRFDEGQLILCISDPLTDARPTEFSAPRGSGTMLMVLKRTGPVDGNRPAAPPVVATPAPVAPPADEDLRRQLPGIWRIPDQLGWIHLRFRENGSFSSCRVHQELRLFRSVFVELPVSRGSWEVDHGQIRLNVFATTDPTRVGTRHCFTVVSMTPAEFVFVDGFGRTNTATREVPPTELK